MKRLFNVLVITLALNFLAVAGFVGWLHQTGRLDRARALANRDILFPKPAAVVATTQPAPAPHPPARRPSSTRARVCSIRPSLVRSRQSLPARRAASW